jgi:SAM-dependent methyltransferase
VRSLSSSFFSRRWKVLRACLLTYAALFVAFVLFKFPYHTDPVRTGGRVAAVQDFYDQAYAPQPSPEEAAKEELYVETARKAAEQAGVEPLVRAFVERYGLENKRVLDVGSGRGYLQDMVNDYTGLDISANVRRFYHKAFVQGSATEMPFEDNSFDAIWSIWVLEHVPNPEQMLVEVRRVLKPGGLVLMAPAWNCSPWAANGYAVRPYRDFGVAGKLVKAGLPLLESPLLAAAHQLPARAVRWAGAKLGDGPTAFHYRMLVPNYQQYWMPDSDALNSMDPYEAYLWFTSRGDECLSCAGGMERAGSPGDRGFTNRSADRVVPPTRPWRRSHLRPDFLPAAAWASDLAPVFASARRSCLACLSACFSTVAMSLVFDTVRGASMGVSRISMRRFLARPFGVLLLAMGWNSP